MFPFRRVGLLLLLTATCASSNKPTYETCSTKQPEPTQIIVSFKQYKHAQDHEVDFEQLMVTTVRGVARADWKIVPRNNPASAYPTDFLLLEVNGMTVSEVDSLMKQLKKSDTMKSVTTQKVIRRSLSSFDGDKNEPGFKKPQRFKTDGAFIEPESPEAHGRSLLSGNAVTTVMGASYIWDQGYTGKNIKVAIFDTGISKNHPHFNNIDERTNWTDEDTLDDGLGHGTFVAGLVGT